MRTKRVLLTFGGGHLAIGIARALRASRDDIHIIATDSSKYHLFQSDADELHLIPRADSEAFIRVLSKIAEKTDADFVWPMHDAEIKRLSEARNEFPHQTWVPPVEVVRICRDKLATFERLKSSGVPVPESLSIDSEEDLAFALGKFGEIWLRSRTGAGAQGAIRTSKFAHAVAWLDIHDGWGSFMAAEVLPCPVDYSWEAILKDGKLIASQVITRLIRGSTGISIPGVRARTVALNDAPEDVHYVSEQAVRAVMDVPDGMFRVDLLADDDGAIRVTEVDAGRFGSGGIAFWHEYAPNFPEIVLRLAFDESIGYDTPIINPSPTDKVVIQSINRDAAFADLSDVEDRVKEFESLL